MASAFNWSDYLNTKPSASGSVWEDLGAGVKYLHGGGHGGVDNGNGNGNDNDITIVSSSHNYNSAVRRIRWKRVLCAFSGATALMVVIVAIATTVSARSSQVETATAIMDAASAAISGDDAAGAPTNTQAQDITDMDMAIMDEATVDLIENAASSVSGDSAFIEHTPANAALEWMLTQSNANLLLQNQVSGETAHMIAQRFALVAVLFALYGDNDNHGRAHQEEALFIMTGAAANTSECEWTDMVTCNEQGFVTKIFLGSRGLQGYIPAELGSFPHLKWLDLSGNHLTGDLPMELHHLEKLEHLYLQQNDGGLMNNNKNNAGAVCSLRSKYRLVHFEIDCVIETTMSGGGTTEGKHNNGVEAATDGALNCACCTKCYPVAMEQVGHSNNIGNNGNDNDGDNDNNDGFVLGDYVSSFWKGDGDGNGNGGATRDEIIREIIFGLYSDSDNDDNNITTNSSSNSSNKGMVIKPGTPQNKALLWLLYEDSMELVLLYEEDSIMELALEHNNDNDSDNNEEQETRVSSSSRVVSVDVTLEIVQRYVLAVIYFSMIGTNDGVSWIFDYGESSVCQWEGIQCSGGEGRAIGESTLVTNIDLGGKQLEGEIPSEIKHLSKLRHLDLSDNDIVGSVPSEISMLTHLEMLYLQDNQLSGDISSSICQLRFLHLQHFVVDCDVVTCACCTSCGKV